MYLTEDILQNIFVTVLQCLKNGPYKETGNFKAWLFSITRSEIARTKKKRFRDPLQELSVMEDIDLYNLHNKFFINNETPEVLLIQLENRRILMEIIHTLPPVFRRAFVLRECHELSYDEIATRCHAPMGTIRTRIRLARRRVAACIKKMEHREFGMVA